MSNDKTKEQKRFEAACAALTGLLAKYGDQADATSHYKSAVAHADKLIAELDKQ